MKVKYSYCNVMQEFKVIFEMEFVELRFYLMVLEEILLEVVNVLEVINQEKLNLKVEFEKVLKELILKSVKLVDIESECVVLVCIYEFQFFI